MTLAEFVTAVRRRHRAIGDTNWSDAEIYDLLTHRINESLIYIGLLEDTDTSTTTVASTQAYDLPDDCVRLVNLLYDGDMLQQISMRDWESQKAGGETPEGESIQYVIWNRQVLLVPIPSEAVTLTFYYEKEHPYIDGVTQTTIDAPSALHGLYIDGVMADMYAKDLNQQSQTMYENKWNERCIPLFLRYAQRSKHGGRVKTVLDADSHLVTDRGMA